MIRNGHSNITVLPRRIAQLTIFALMAAVVMAADAARADAMENDVSAEPTDTKMIADETSVPRDPFWPVGYTPPRPEGVNDEPDKPDEPDEPDKPEIEPPAWGAAAERLRFQGRFTARGRVLASVNGEIVEVGSVIGVRLPPYVYYWRITAIDQYGIETEPVDAKPID